MGAFLTGAVVAGIARYVLTTIGFGIISYVGIDTLINGAFSAIRSNLQGSDTVLYFIGAMNIDKAISFVISGYTIRLTLATIKKLTLL